MNSGIKIVRAGIENLEMFAQIYRKQREFYGKDNEPAKEYEFLRQRLKENNTVIFLAEYDFRCIGMVQLYPIFSWVSMERLWELHDLFVDTEYRRHGAGKLLLETAKNFVKESKSAGLILQVSSANVFAIEAYEKTGFVKNSFLTYYWSNKK